MIPPFNPKTMVLAYKGQFWKDPDSIKSASITTPVRRSGMWQLCVRANAKNAFGGYTGEKDNLIGYFDGHRPPEVLASDAQEPCAILPHEPFPELEGTYKPAQSAAKPKA